MNLQHPPIPERLYRGMSKTSCNLCGGTGSRYNAIQHRNDPCRCTLRNICRTVMGAYVASELKTYKPPIDLSKGTSRVQGGLSNRYQIWSELRADIWLTVKRGLTPVQFAVWKAHYLDDLDAPAACQKLRIDRSMYFGRLYLAEQAAGRAFCDVGLWELRYYLYGRVEAITPRPVLDATRRAPLRPPLANKPAPAPVVPMPAPVVVIPAPVAVPPPPAAPPEPLDPAAYVRELWAEGLEFGAIIDRLHKRGVPCPDGPRWSKTSVKRVLWATARLPKAA